MLMGIFIHAAKVLMVSENHNLDELRSCFSPPGPRTSQLKPLWATLEVAGHASVMPTEITRAASQYIQQAFTAQLSGVPQYRAFRPSQTVLFPNPAITRQHARRVDFIHLTSPRRMLRRPGGSTPYGSAATIQYLAKHRQLFPPAMQSILAEHFSHEPFARRFLGWPLAVQRAWLGAQGRICGVLIGSPTGKRSTLPTLHTGKLTSRKRVIEIGRCASSRFR